MTQYFYIYKWFFTTVNAHAATSIHICKHHPDTHFTIVNHADAVTHHTPRTPPHSAPPRGSAPAPLQGRYSLPRGGALSAMLPPSPLHTAARPAGLRPPLCRGGTRCRGAGGFPCAPHPPTPTHNGVGVVYNCEMRVGVVLTYVNRCGGVGVYSCKCLFTDVKKKRGSAVLAL